MNTITARNKYLTNIINRKIMTLEEEKIVLEMFKKYYTPCNADAPMSELKDIKITLEYNNFWNNWCFYAKYEIYGICRKDSISKKYMAGATRTNKCQVISVLRDLINYTTIEFRNKQKALGKITYGMEVDHKYPFSNIVEDFLKMKKLKYSDIERVNTKLVSPKNIEKEWIEYHNKVVEYQLIPREENRKKSNKTNYIFISKPNKPLIAGFSLEDL